MKSWIWFRALAVVLALFSAGHTIGTIPRITRGAQEEALFTAMQGFRFPIMGFTRSYWDFYRGFSLTITVDLAALAVIAWQLGTISREEPRRAIPIGVTLLMACVATLLLSGKYFFGGPILSSGIAIICAGGALMLARREALGRG